MLEAPSSVELADAVAFLGERFAIDPASVEFVGEGAWSRCFGFAHNGAEMVVRFGRHLEDFQRDRFAAHFAARDLPIPQVTEIDEAFGAWYCVSTRARGTPLELLDAGEWRLTAPSVLATLDALRSADLSQTTGFGEWDNEGVAQHSTWAEYLASVMDDESASRTHGWKRRLVDSPIGDASFVRAYDVMCELAEYVNVERSLVHNDLLNRNALAAGGQVTALFDWGCSIYGDFLYDLATFSFWSPWHPAIANIDMRSMALQHYADMGLELANFDARLRCCLLHIGLVHLAYNAFLGDDDTLLLTDRRMNQFLDRPL